MKQPIKKNLKLRDKVQSIGGRPIFFALLFLSCTVASAQDNGGFVVDEIIAKVDNYIVLKSELDRAYQDYVTNGGSPSQQARCQYLALLIRNKLMMAKAEIDSVVVSDADVDVNSKRRMDAILAQAGNSPEDLESKFGKTLEQIQLELRDQIREQMVVSKMEEKVSEGISVTPAEVRRFFNKIPKDSLPYFSASVEVAQIVKIAQISESQKDVTKRQLIELRDRILAGEDFATLAKKYSTDPSVTGNGGDMGFVGRGQLVPEFEATSFKLKPGEISMPVETQYGLHIIQLIERRGNEYHSRHILISFSPSQDDLNKASRYLDSLRTLIINDSITFQKAAKEYSDDVQTKAIGGFFTDQSGGLQIPVDEIDPIVYFKIDSMKVGEVSTPIVYRTDEGRDAVRILFYKSRIAPHEASLKDDWNRIQVATLNEKKARMLQKWFLKARQDVFINIDATYNSCGILDE
jgi:peptidyl-prolyl cis-trans isomerase SurA